MTQRTIKSLHDGLKTHDGADVKLTRIIGQPSLKNLDPFLMLDAFGTDEPMDYIGGFPPHPHRGFETVTYLIAGNMRHQDNQGNEGVIRTGGVQWMTAGRGIIHSEMPEQTKGLLMGFQLWVNLPSHAKMSEPKYQEYEPEQMPIERHDNGAEIRVIAGTTYLGTTGLIKNEFVDPTYLDVTLPAEQCFKQSLKTDETAFIYLHEGEVQIADNSLTIQAGQLAVLSAGESVEVTAYQPSRFILVAGSPLKEPIVQRGPFVMNTEEEINQAMDDYQNNRF
ncbi:MAG: pirin family protein [Thiotrichales bacterium]|nr:pirin family protein [Thiotrichales bacterium]